MPNKPIASLSDAELATEWNKWNDYIVAATSWGAALAAASEFRASCRYEILRRNIHVENFVLDTYRD